jgi:hypothetical protein
MMATREPPTFSLVSDNRPVILIGTGIERMTHRAISALSGDEETYQRGGSLVHIACVTKDDPSRKWKLPVGSPHVVDMGRATLHCRLSACARWVRKGKSAEDFSDVRPDRDTVGAVLEAGQWEGVRMLVGITDTPMLRPDGSVLQEPGYDAATGHVYMPCDAFPRVPDDPTPEDAREALAMLLEPISDFPFGSDAQRHVLVAELCTVLARAAINGAVPLFAHDASTRGSGKTLAADVVSLLALGECGRCTYSDDPEEFRKVLDGYAHAAARLVVIDNVVGPIDSATLNAYVTSNGKIEIRILGRTGQHSIPWTGVIVLTGNNLDPRGDLIRRILVARLEPDCERPESRTDFRHGNLRTYVTNSRPRLVCAALTMLRAYCLAGRPDVGIGTWGSFEAWAELIPAAIRWAGGPNVLDARPESDASMDPETGALSMLLAMLPRLSGGVPMKTRDVVATLYPESGRGGAPDGYDDLREAIETLTRTRSGTTPNGRALGDAFRRYRGRWIDGRSLVSMGNGHNGLMWTVQTRIK